MFCRTRRLKVRGGSVVSRGQTSSCTALALTRRILSIRDPPSFKMPPSCIIPTYEHGCPQHRTLTQLGGRHAEARAPPAWACGLLWDLFHCVLSFIYLLLRLCLCRRRSWPVFRPAVCLPQRLKDVQLQGCSGIPRFLLRRLLRFRPFELSPHIHPNLGSAWRG